MRCPICGGERERWFSARVLTQHDAEFHFCQDCGYLGAADPHWIDEAYANPIAKMDTGLLSRNAALARRCIPVIYVLLSGDRSSTRCLDFAGGYGLFTRLMRDAGYDYYWTDKYSDNLFARGFEYEPSLGSCAVVSAFEVLEHATDPLGLVQEALAGAMSSNLLFTTELFDGFPPKPDQWWYYAFESGQHISFFQRRTLERMASLLGLHFSTYRGLHAFTREPIPFRLRFSGGGLNRISLPWVQTRLDSKTVSDHEQIAGKLTNDRDE